MFDPLALAREIQDAPTFERRVLEELQSHIGCDVAFLTLKGDIPTTLDVDAAKLDAAMASADYAREILPLKCAALTGGGIVVDTTLLGEKAVRKLRYHREFARPIGGRHTLFAFLSLRGRNIGGLMLGRSGSTFSSAEIDRIRDLLPDLTMARVSFRAPWSPAALCAASRVDIWSRLKERAGTVRPLDRVALGDDIVEVRDRAGHREINVVVLGRITAE